MEDLQQEHKIDFSVIIPVYNGVGSIEELSDKLISFFESINYTFELIFVDDYSQDESWSKIKNLKKKHAPFVKGLRLSKNFGQHIATCAGFKLAEGNFIVTIDDDLEVEPSNIKLLIDNQLETKSTIVYGHLTEVKRSLFRKFFKFLYSSVARILEGENKVKGSSFRLIKSELAKKIEQKATHFVFIDEVFLWYTDEISYVSVQHCKSKRKQSNYTPMGLFKLTSDVVIYSSILPLKFIKYIGFLCSSINFIIGVFYLYQKLINNLTVPGYASIVISVLFSTGLIIFILGVLGEYLSKMFYLMNNRPVYLVDEEI
jgi:undecaprenyl-phosphate 4-deoxy-4-formamido-L-arabinose transferase